ncbi:MAG TPA: hypothetical protein VGM03_08670 [Phycisphaerae bacterium]
MPQKQHKKRRLGSSDQGIVRHRPQHKNDVWAWDFVHDRDQAARPLKWLTLIDEYTRECLALPGVVARPPVARSQGPFGASSDARQARPAR